MPLLADPNSHFYVCGLKAMEEGVVLALRDVAVGAPWYRFLVCSGDPVVRSAMELFRAELTEVKEEE